MPNSDARLVLYAVDLGELRVWIGCRDEVRFRDAWELVRDDEDAEWTPEERAVLERLLRRVLFEGQLYEGLEDAERYYLTQLLIDLFDEYVDQDPLSEDLRLDALLRAAEALPRGGEAARMVSWLLRGRELNGERLVWESGPVEDVLAYFGYVTREEAPRLASALTAAMATMRGRPSGLLKQLQNAAEECARAELDLVSFIG